MKKTLLTGALLLFITGMTAQTTTTDLPQRAQDFISKNFSSETAAVFQSGKKNTGRWI